MPQLNVLVVGASIAGPMTAYWLAKAGAKVTVIERFPELRTGGQNIDIRTVGVTVMRMIPGMEEAVRAKTVEMDGLCFVRDNGRPYGYFTASGDPDQQTLISEYEIYRGDLAQILVDLVKDNENVSYVFGEQIASIQQTDQEEGPVTVEFANGFPTSQYDLVVACDGATGRTRAIGLGCGARDYIKPMNKWAAFFSMPQDLLDGSKYGHAFTAPGGRFISALRDSSGKTRVGIMVMNPSNGSEAMLPFREAMKQGDDALRRFIAQYYKGVGWKTQEMLEGLMDATDLYANEIVQVQAPNIYKGRFAMVGDAGYGPGPTGGGTTLAIAGAYLLAGEICKHKDNLSEGLEAYEAQMRPLIDEFHKIPPFVFTVMAPQTAWGVWLRNHIFALVTWSGIVQFVQRFFLGAAAFSSPKKYPLPEYEWVA